LRALAGYPQTLKPPNTQTLIFGKVFAAKRPLFSYNPLNKFYSFCNMV
jgi:hypothetical protein